MDHASVEKILTAVMVLGVVVFAIVRLGAGTASVITLQIGAIQRLCFFDRADLSRSYRLEYIWLIEKESCDYATQQFQQFKRTKS